MATISTSSNTYDSATMAAGDTHAESKHSFVVDQDDEDEYDDDEDDDDDQGFVEPTFGFRALMARWTDTEAADKAKDDSVHNEAPRMRRPDGSMIRARKASLELGVIKEVEKEPSTQPSTQPTTQPTIGDQSLVATRRASLESSTHRLEKVNGSNGKIIVKARGSLVANRRASLESSAQKTTSKSSGSQINLPGGVVASRRASLECSFKAPESSSTTSATTSAPTSATAQQNPESTDPVVEPSNQDEVADKDERPEEAVPELADGLRMKSASMFASGSGGLPFMVLKAKRKFLALRGRSVIVDRTKTRQDLKDEFIAKEGNATGKKNVFRMPGNLYEAAPKFKKGFKPPKFLKTDTEIAIIKKALKKNFVFANLTRKQMKPLIDAFEPYALKSKQVLIKQGDAGDYFYIVEKGRVKFQVNGVEVGKAGKGTSFGELALLYTCPRAATVIAAGKETRVFRVDQKTFQFILQNQTKESEKEKLELLKRVNFLKDLDRSDLKDLAAVMTPHFFAAGDVIVKKGDIGDAFYVIQEGNVAVTDISVGTTTYEDITLGPGDHFGERALVTLEPRAANVVGQSRGVAFSIDQETFNNVLGSMSSLILKAQDVRVLSGVKLLQKAKLSHEDISDLADLLTESFFMHQQTIIEEGKKVIPSLYYIREGEATITSKTGESRVITQGGYFGQELMVLACENNTPRVISPYTVTCSVYSTVAVLSLADCRYIFDVSLLIKEEDKEDGLPLVEKTKIDIDLKTIEKKKILGAGTFGQVWLVSANDKSGNNGVYALKIQSKYDIAFDHQISAVIRESKILMEVNHPFVLNQITAYQDASLLYFLAEFIQGGELFYVIHNDKGSGLEESKAKFYVLAIADALSHLHRSKIVYRDLKPENVLIDRFGYPKIVDFGFAKVVDDKTFTFCGTPGYIAPEIITKRGHNVSADHWSLGILVYEMLVGENPFYFEGMDQFGLFRSICEDEHPPLSRFSPEVAEFVDQLLIKDPSQRLGSVKQGEKRVLEHPWFKELDLPAMRRREAAAPWVPDLRDPLDTSNFEAWDDLVDKSTEKHPALSSADAKEFNDSFKFLV